MAIRPHTFPPYVYQEFPKWVTKPDGTRVVVHNAAEENVAVCGAAEPPPMVAVDEPLKRGPGRPRKTEG